MMNVTETLGIISVIVSIALTVVNIISAIVTIRAKKDVQRIREEIKMANVDNEGDIMVENAGINTGVVLGINSGDIRK